MSIFTICCKTCMYCSVLLDFVWRCFDKLYIFQPPTVWFHIFHWLETQNVFYMEWWLSFMYCAAVYNDQIIRMLNMISGMTCPCVRVLHNFGGHVPRLKSWKEDGGSFRVWNFPAVLGDKSLAAICVTLFTDVAGGTFQWLGGASKWILLRELEFCLTGTRLLVQRLPLRSHLTTLHILSSIPRSGPRSQFYANYLRHCAVLQRERVPHLGFVGFCRLL